MRYVIAVDLGGTQLRAGLVDTEGRVYDEIRLLTRAEEGPEAVIERIVGAIAQVRKALPEGGALLGVGIGSPGPLDPFEGTIITMPNLPGWENVPLRDEVARRTGLDVELGNDANAAVMGEWIYGSGRGARDLVYLTISTGIGGGVIADGRLILGHRGLGTELGLYIIDVNSRMRWEELASGTGLAHAAAAAMRSTPDSQLHALATPETVTAAEVSRAAAAGDPLAQQLMAREAELLGIGLVNVLHLFSPERILLGGGVIINNPQLLPEISKVVQEVAIPVYRGVPIQVAALGDRVGLLGASALFLNVREGLSGE